MDMHKEDIPDTQQMKIYNHLYGVNGENKWEGIEVIMNVVFSGG